MAEPRALSGDTKDALARAAVEAAHCRAALRDGLLVYGTDPRTGAFRTQRPAIARLARALFDDRRDAGVRKIAGTRLRRLPTYEIELVERVTPRKPAARCDRRMEWRAAFLACGSLASPARGYHLEFVPQGDAAV
ncbi:MAG: hypothetical protein IAI50_18350, partial [Candidatus Eremiobacteraeota bacterium]|nr:hypothetical protein [Candidatus Eremiobacteraeota bacterium]